MENQQLRLKRAVDLYPIGKKRGLLLLPGHNELWERWLTMQQMRMKVHTELFPASEQTILNAERLLDEHQQKTDASAADASKQSTVVESVKKEPANETKN
jgi:hypothetical protein